ncbi:ATP-binding protein [Streptomyces sp. BE147]|uniref:ATP-binding protein n=1 Tax=unclassified Streptomyces TaxID=2593676 RepID=UPI002E75AC74|nr:ATP-binding protein [Streptomyces sp. BE147]MEE1735869.1 ATP-binding protein [Streptomyces sp. BE147]
MTAVGWIVALLAAAWAATAVVRAQQSSRDVYAATARAELAERQAKAAEARTLALTDEIRQLAERRIPAAATALSHPTASVPGLREAADIDGDAARLLTEAVQAARAAVVEERQRVDAAARAAMRGTSAKIQSLLNQSQQLLHELQHEYDDPRILQLDFRNELALRRTQATAVLCDAWPGLARQNSPLVEIVLGAQSRVAGYERIRVANHLREERLALVARAAEPLAIVLAELLANATAYSHPDTEVPVTVQQTPGRGALVLVDDAGIGMDDDALERARALLAGPSEVLLTELGDPPQTGFAVVGRLVARYGFSCHIESSPYGGMRTMLRVPAHLLTVMEDDRTLSVLAPKPVDARPQPAPEARSAPALAPKTTEAAEAVEAVETPGAPGIPAAPGVPAAAVPGRPAADAGPRTELPTRRRRTRRPAAQEPAGAGGPVAEEPAPRTPEQAGASWTALQQGTVSGRNADATATTAQSGGTAEPGGTAEAARSGEAAGPAEAAESGPPVPVSPAPAASASPLDDQGDDET